MGSGCMEKHAEALHDNNEFTRLEHYSELRLPFESPTDYDITVSERVKHLDNMHLFLAPENSNWHNPLLVTLRTLRPGNRRRGRQTQVSKVEKRKAHRKEVEEEARRQGTWKSKKARKRERMQVAAASSSHQ